MSDLLQFKLINADALVKRFRTGATTLGQALRMEMMNQMARAADWSRANRLSGDPLNRRSGRLSRSITPFAKLENGRIVGGLSSNVPYAHVHELGGIFTIPEYTRRPARSRTAAGKFRKRTEEQQVSSVTVKQHTATFPERAFLKPALVANRDQVLQGLRSAIIRTVQP